MNIKFNNLNAQWLAIKDQAMPEIEELFCIVSVHTGATGEEI